MIRVVAAATAALILLSSASMAQDTSGQEMLLQAVERILKKNGIDNVDAKNLTLSQLAEIHNVVGSNGDRNQADRMFQVSVVLERSE